MGRGARGTTAGDGGASRSTAWVMRVLAALLALLCAAPAGCGVMDDGKPPEDAIRVTPKDRSHGVPTDARVEVSVPEGRLRSVRMQRVGKDAGRPVAGRFSADRRSWRPLPASAGQAAGRAGGQRGDRVLQLASTYEVDVVAVDGEGDRVIRHATFSTRVPPHRFVGYFRPEHNQTVGTAMIVSLDFSRPIADRAAVERAIRVSSEPRVPVAAHWFGPGRLDFRPRTFWQPGTRVTLDLRLRDVRGAPGVYGTQRKRVRFTIGRDQRSVVDVGRRTLTVQRGGSTVERFKITAGTKKNPTYNGHMVISEKFVKTRMNGRTVGFGGEYDIKDVPHAMRLTRSGTFLHGNYWAPRRIFGTKNTSHGCIGLADKRGGDAKSPAGRFFRHSLVGDLVTVRGSHDRTVAPGNGLGGWNMSWEKWVAGSALR
ncbi:L,D-transpeptidase family protein [Streptomyces albus subsp. chlorinus]|uniref:L,D-transpeptidase n=1 Tax=Streptomyces albus TaxID=1888 RepID=UPI00156F4FFC|nr:Ig-like domain-containing protein [Streptomyces albus]NSC23994.1 L,D-transpeptidase family protein [Streptomyces albus subsp. chlorinus]